MKKGGVRRSLGFGVRGLEFGVRSSEFSVNGSPFAGQFGQNLNPFRPLRPLRLCGEPLLSAPQGGNVTDPSRQQRKQYRDSKDICGPIPTLGREK